jgi:hypothetical protein
MNLMPMKTVTAPHVNGLTQSLYNFCKWILDKYLAAKFNELPSCAAKFSHFYAEFKN